MLSDAIWLRRLRQKSHEMINDGILVRIGSDDSGQGLLEYALLLSVIVLGTVGAVAQLAQPIGNPFTKVALFFAAYK